MVKLWSLLFLAVGSSLTYISGSGIVPRITNGDLVGAMKDSNGEMKVLNIGQYPYMAALELLGIYNCGAVIIKKDVILTAAHCTENLNAAYYTVRAGTFKKLDRSGKHVQVKRVRKIIEHPLYNKTSERDNDISILFLKDSFDLNQYVNVIEMATWDFPGMKAEIMGWGRNEWYREVNDLMKAEVEVVPEQQCSTILKDLINITGNMVCTLSPSTIKRQGSCKGDSGGPLVFRHPQGPLNDQLIGLASFSKISEYVQKNSEGKIVSRIFRCNSNLPVVYANIVSLRSWVLEELVKDSIK